MNIKYEQTIHARRREAIDILLGRAWSNETLRGAAIRFLKQHGVRGAA